MAVRGSPVRRDRNTIVLPPSAPAIWWGAHRHVRRHRRAGQISHKASSRLTFANGAVRAAVARPAGAGLYDMQDVTRSK